MEWHQQSIESVLSSLSANKSSGLSADEAQRRMRQYGPNVLRAAKGDSWFTIFLRQFYNPLIYILLLAAVIIFFTSSDTHDAFIITGVLLFNAIIGTIQEGRTKNIIESLRRFIKTETVVLRDGKKMVLADEQLVPGDIIVLQTGQKIPADARVIESHALAVDEAVLTGESRAVRKQIEPLPSVVLADRTNMVYRGTHVMAGLGMAVVVATGKQTEVGAISQTVHEIDTDIPLKRELERLSYVILIFIFILCSLLFAVGFALGKPAAELLTMLTALFICVVPEGLPVVLTLVLVSGAYRMAKRNVLVKNLQAVETLGRTDVVVIDKTGTLTRNEMLVSQVVTAEGKTYQVKGRGYFQEGSVLENSAPVFVIPGNELYHVACASYLLNGAQLTFVPERNLFELSGDPTEAAMYVFAQKTGIDWATVGASYVFKQEIPFDSAYKFHAAFFEHKRMVQGYLIGAPEILFSFCSKNDRMQEQLSRLLSAGKRVIAVAQMSAASLPEQTPESVKQLPWQLAGLCGMQDSIRTEVRGVIAQARKAGMRIIMATGDHQETALYVAREVGLIREGDQAIEGAVFEKLTDEQALEQLYSTVIYARVSPTAKTRIIDLFHQRGNIVAMTGDGINDAPSLVAADLGIAMGSIGTEIAKEAADIVLFDDSFENIMSAVQQGRHIFYTLRRVILYFFSTNMGEICIVLFGLLSGLPLPITAAQILWLNLVTDGFLDIALSMEPEEEGLLRKELLQHKPRLVDRALIAKMMIVALPMGIGSLCVFAAYYKQDLTHARTMTLLTMAMFQWFNAWNCRSETKSIFQLGLLSNRWLIGATVFVLALQGALLHLPVLQTLFKTVPLSWRDWLVVCSVSMPIVVIEEVRKWVVRRWMS